MQIGNKFVINLIESISQHFTIIIGYYYNQSCHYLPRISLFVYYTQNTLFESFYTYRRINIVLNETNVSSNRTCFIYVEADKKEQQKY